MQMMVEVSVTPDEYAEQGYHRQIQRPEQCPVCRAKHSMRGHGTYSRSVSGLRERELSISIRRFRCKLCGHTASLLPSFAHPHRFVNLITIERFIRGLVTGADVLRNMELLRRYQRLLMRWIKRVRLSKERTASSARRETPARAYKCFIAKECSLSKTTVALVNRHHTSLFGDYRCLRLPAAA